MSAVQKYFFSSIFTVAFILATTSTTSFARSKIEPKTDSKYDQWYAEFEAAPVATRTDFSHTLYGNCTYHYSPDVLVPTSITVRTDKGKIFVSIYDRDWYSPSLPDGANYPTTLSQDIIDILFSDMRPTSYNYNWHELTAGQSGVISSSHTSELFGSNADNLILINDSDPTLGKHCVFPKPNVMQIQASEGHLLYLKNAASALRTPGKHTIEYGILNYGPTDDVSPFDITVGIQGSNAFRFKILGDGTSDHANPNVIHEPLRSGQRHNWKVDIESGEGHQNGALTFDIHEGDQTLVHAALDF